MIGAIHRIGADQRKLSNFADSVDRQAARFRYFEPMSLPEEISTSSEETLQELVYAVSHDLGASARAIRGFSDLLTRRYGNSLDDDGQNFLRLLSKGASDLQAQLDGLLAYSRVVTRGGPMQPTLLHAVWQSVLDTNATKIRDAGASVESGDLPIVLADSNQLTQLLSELLQNSLKFRRTEPFGTEPLRIVLSVERCKSSNANVAERWLLKVSDTGRGIPDQHQKRVFQMFQRLCHDVPGIGAGLAICRRIAERHGGRIWVESNSEFGSTFCFTLPANGEGQS